MEILVSGKFSADVSAGALAIANKLRGLVEATNIRDVDAALDSLVFFPVILSDDLGIDLKSHRSHSRMEKADFANVEISHERWVAADSDARFQLMFEALTEALIDTKPERLSPAAVTEIVGRLRNAR